MMNRQSILVVAVVISVSVYAAYSGLFPTQDGSDSTILDVLSRHNKFTIDLYNITEFHHSSPYTFRHD